MKKTLQNYFEESGNTWITRELFFKQGYVADHLVSRERNGIEYVSTSSYSKAEELIAVKLIDKLLEPHKDFSREEVDFYIDWYQMESGFILAQDQREAVHMAMNHTISVLTGGPGTGKTCVLKAVDFISHQMKRDKIVFCAPTGKAARRITESVGKPATTTQKAMNYSPNSKKLKMLVADLIINDEVSIMDMETFLNFLCSVATGTHLLFVGDVDQLPSVGPGAVLRDMIDSGVIPVTKLEQTFRQSNDSCIFRNIQRIKRGISNLEDADDFRFLEIQPSEAQDILIKEYLSAVKKYGRDGVICLTPYRRKGDTCSNVMNNILQDILNPIGKRPFLRTEVIENGETEKRKVVFQVGDPVMQLVNRKECANGDVGKIVSVGEKGISVQYIDCSVFYPVSKLGQISLAYALSIHKSQGSEYPCVITPILPEHREMLNRNIIYTAVTRAKKEMIILGRKSLIPEALAKETGYERITFLAEEIRLEYKKRLLLKTL